MTKFLILKLQAPLQAWGKPSHENFRPTEVFPTRSGIVGLIGSCLGIKNTQPEKLFELSKSFQMVVRLDDSPYVQRKIVDFQSVQSPRVVPGSNRTDGIITNREYLCDSTFTVGLEFVPDSKFNLEDIVAALKNPIFTPYLGRKNCIPTRRLFEKIEENCETLIEAIKSTDPGYGRFWSEIETPFAQKLIMKDVPTRFGLQNYLKRSVYVFDVIRD